MPVGCTERPGGTRVRMMWGAVLVPMPGLAAYGAAKAGIAAYSAPKVAWAAWGDAPQRELAPRGLHVLNVDAGLAEIPTDTPMLRRSPLAAKMSPAESPHALAAGVVQALAEGRRALWRGSPERVAQLRAARDDPRLGDALRA